MATVTLGGTDTANDWFNVTTDMLSTSWTAAQTFSLTTLKFSANAAAGTALVRMAVYSDSAGSPSSLLGQTSEVTGAALGTNTLTLTAPVAISSGSTVWVAFGCRTAGVQVNRSTTATPKSKINSGGYPGASGFPASWGSVTTGTSRYLLWGEGTSSAGSGCVVWVGI